MLLWRLLCFPLPIAVCLFACLTQAMSCVVHTRSVKFKACDHNLLLACSAISDIDELVHERLSFSMFESTMVDMISV